MKASFVNDDAGGGLLQPAARYPKNRSEDAD